jgi:Na+/H+-dicarboxylate symporter
LYLPGGQLLCREGKIKNEVNRMKKKLSLPVQIVIALILGVIVGLIASFIEGGPAFTADYLKPFGTIFVNLLKFIVVPVVLLSMIQGIVSMEDMKKVGSVGWKTVAFFLVTTAIACVIGLVLGNVFDKAGLFPTLVLGEGDKWTGSTSAKFMDTLVNIFPSNMWTAFTKADMLQVIVIALFFGGSILAAGEKATLVRNFVDSAYAVIEKLMGFIISLSPIGVFTMMAWVVATQGAAILGSLGLVLLCAYIAYAIHAICVYSVAAKAFGKIGPFKFFKGAAAAMMFAFTSTSSAATLPVSKQCAEDLGADKDVAAFVLPLGATITWTAPLSTSALPPSSWLAASAWS